MAVDLLSENSNMSPRISFSRDFCQSDSIPIEKRPLRSSTSKPTSLNSSIDFDFCIPGSFNSGESFDQGSWSADELFSNGKILPTEIKKKPEPVQKRSAKDGTGQPRTKPDSRKQRKPEEEEEEGEDDVIKPNNTKSFWGFKRSSSLNCGTSYGRSLCPLPLLSRSNSTGSTSSKQKQSTRKQTDHVKLQQSSSLSSSSSSSSSLSNSNFQKPPLKKNYGGYSYGSHHQGGGIRVSTFVKAMDERPETELISIPATPRASTPEILTPSGQRSPRPTSKDATKSNSAAWTPTSFISPRFLSPIGTPMKRVLVNMKGYLEEVGHLTKLNPQDAWLPITESRNGNAYYAAFHNLNAGVGFQALVLPVAFAFLGWSWGILSLTIAYIWQLYTLWVLVQLHEAVPGKRYNRYVELAQAAFGERLGVWLALFPTVYLSAGTATALILIGGETMKLFFQIVCGPLCTSNPLTTVEWYLVFTSLCIVLSQLPNLNSIAGLSLIGAVTAITYSTMVWVLSVSQQRPATISYEPLSMPTFSGSLFSVLNALGIVAFAFRGHNLALEIQSTMPSTFKHPAHVPMWRGAKVAYFFIALCIFPISIGGFWAYGNLMPSGGMLSALYAFHIHDIPRGLLATAFLLVVFNCLSSFQIYSMPAFDSFEAGYTSRTNKPCSIWVRSGFRVFFGFVSFFIGVALPFLSSLAGLLGGLTLPVTFAYPCFMWALIKRPAKYSFSWYFHWGLGWLGVAFSLAFSIGGIWSMVTNGLKLKFFKPPS